MNIKNSFSVGLPCMKLSLNPSTQKHNGKAAKTCGVGAAWDEMDDDRKGRDKTIDRNLTENNVWLIGNTDIDMVAVVQAEVDRVSADRKEHGKRALRKDAVSALEMIEKPPMDIMADLSREEQIELLTISNEVYEELLHEWAPDWKTQAAVIHFDEFGGKSPHTHRIVTTTTKDENGILNMNAKQDFNLKFFTFINTNYPKKMRERGIPIKDCNSYELMTEEEKTEHKEKKKEYGVDAVTYKIKKAAELDKNLEYKENQIVMVDNLLADRWTKSINLLEKNNELSEEVEKKEAKKEVLDSDIEKLNSERSEVEEDVKKLKEERRSYKFGLEEYDPDKWKIEEPGKLELAASYKKRILVPFINKLLKKLKNLIFKYNNCCKELNDCKSELIESEKRLDKKSESCGYWQQKCSELAREVTGLKDKVKEYDLVKKVLGSEKVAELVSRGREMENAEIQQRERERQLKRSRNRGMSL